MKVKYADILAVLQDIDSIRKLKLPIRYSLKVAQALRAAQTSWQDFEMVKKQILDEAGFRDLDGLPESEREEQRKKNEQVLPLVNAKLNEALDQEVEISYEPVPLNLKDDEGGMADVGVMEKIWWMFS